MAGFRVLAHGRRYSLKPEYQFDGNFDSAAVLSLVGFDDLWVDRTSILAVAQPNLASGYAVMAIG